MCKRLVFLICFVLVLGAPGRASGGLVAHWAFDEGAGTTAQDSSGNNHHGNIVGNADWVSEGIVGGALHLDGSTYVVVGDNIGEFETFTVALWFKYDSFIVNWNSIWHNNGWSSGWLHHMVTNYAGQDIRVQFAVNGAGDRFGVTPIQAGVWYHSTVTYDSTTGQMNFYLTTDDERQANLDASVTVSGPAVNITAGQIGGWQGGRLSSATFDDLRMYDRILTAAQIEGLVNGIPPAWVKAEAPDPPDGATGVTGPLLSWTPGTTAMWHDVYLGTNPTPGAAEYKGRQPLAWNMWYEVGGWVSGTTYYWRIDEVEADGTTIHVGDVWSFTAAPVSAYNPDPPDGAENVPTDKQLSWTPGATAVTHDVYFGTDETEVTNGTGGTFKGNQSTIPYNPGTLTRDTTYYWRIDEVEQNITIKHTGHVWSFKTLPDIPITNPDLVGWWRFDEGEGTTALDWSGHDHHGTLMGDPQWVPGYDGDALEFDGTDDFVDIYDPGSFDFGTDFTWAAWIKTTNDGTVVARAPATGVWARGGKACFVRGGLWTVDIGWVGYVESTVAVDDGQWHHVATTTVFETAGDNDTTTLYIDGSFAGSRSDWNVNAFSEAGQAVKIGFTNDNFPGTPWFNGQIDDVRIYNRALTAAEIPDTMRGDPTLAWKPRPAHGSVPDIEHATPLTWSPGQKAAKHDVYLGTDRDAVADADTTTTGIYRGRQDPNTYTPPQGVEFNRAYYWRIDEYNTDATISEGRVWNFAVADYLIVDDFESYDDYCNRIFYVWPDGWGHNGDVSCGVPPYGGNGTGSTVGHLSEPYAEQTIVHDGDQSMPMEYLNDGSTGKALYSETERTFDPPQDWHRHGVKALSLWFRGLPASVGSFNYDPGTGIYTITADGQDIWNTQQPPGSGNWVEHDEFHFAYKRLSGVGTIQAQVLSVQNTNGWAKAGVMIRETLDANSVHAMTVITPSQGVSFQRRPTVGGASDHTTQAGIQAPHWVRITRSGNLFTAEHSADGAVWGTLGTAMSIPMAADVYVGLAVTSHNNDPTVACEATFSDVTISGTVTGQWQSQDIGITSNAPERLYVAVEDSTGTAKDVPHPDPNAVQLNTWQEWNIDLADFAPVDVTKVKKMYIGVGDRNAPKLGGSGMLYIDDIRLYRPRCMPDLTKPVADFSDNCIVDYPDLDIMANEWLVDDNNLQADLNLDGEVNFKDYAGLADTWLDELLWP